MCGITAIISKNTNIYQFLVESLKNLQNRGYDSAGICSIKDNELIYYKKASDSTKTAIEYIEENCSNIFEDCTIGIAHTRWATHGNKTDKNSHPHICYKNKLALVHNGIIENYNILKQFLEEKGVIFKSDCDSEIIVNLISYYYNKSLIDAIKEACNMLEGTYAIVLINKDESKLYVTRHGSPLILSKSECSNYIAITSEIIGLNTSLKCFNNYINIKDNSYYTIDLDTFLDSPQKLLNFDSIQRTPLPYIHWTLKEIYDQAETVKMAINYGGRLSNNDIKIGGFEEKKEAILECSNLVLLACGSSYNSALIGSKYFENMKLFQNIKCINPNDFQEYLINNENIKTLAIFISQSGETKDLHNCIEICKKYKNFIKVGIVNVVDSIIARDTDCGIYLNSGREVGVASTKSFTSQVIILILVALWLDKYKNPDNINKRKYYIDQLNDFIQNTGNVLQQIKNHNFEEIVKNIINTKSNSMFILGLRKKDLVIANEGSLKIKELSYIHCEAYNTSSLKHGPISLIEKGTPVIHIINKNNYDDYKLISNSMAEVNSRDGNAILIGNHKDSLIKIDHENEFSYLWVNMILQILAYYLSISKNINPDMPRNLAKVVTVL